MLKRANKYDEKLQINGSFEDLVKEMADKANQFKDELDKIEQANIEYFKSQEPLFRGDQHDELSNYYIIYTADQQVTFNFTPHSNLPQSIRDECLAVFKRVYPIQ